DGVGVTLEGHHRVIALVEVFDFIGKPTLAPHVPLGHFGTTTIQVGFECLDVLLDVILGQIRPMNGHHFIIAHVTSCGHPIGRLRPAEQGLAAPRRRETSVRSLSTASLRVSGLFYETRGGAKPGPAGYQRASVESPGGPPRDAFNQMSRITANTTAAA